MYFGCEFELQGHRTDFRQKQHFSYQLLPSLTEFEDQSYRVRAIHALVHKLPEKNKAMLDLLTNHLLRCVDVSFCPPSPTSELTVMCKR